LQLFRRASYVYEHWFEIARPLFAVEELILEFLSCGLIDTPDCDLAAYYAGAASCEPVSPPVRRSHHDHLAPHYRKAVDLLEDWNRRHDG
jgi:hypothetical protein